MPPATEATLPVSTFCLAGAVSSTKIISCLAGVLGLLIILTPAAYWPMHSWLTIPYYDIGLGIAFTLFLLLHVVPRPRLPKFTWRDLVLGFFLVWSEINALTIGSWTAVGPFADMLLLLFVVSHTHFTASQVRLLIGALVLAGTLMAGFGCHQYLAGHLAEGTLGNRNTFSGYISLILPMSLGLWFSAGRRMRILGVILTTTMAFGVAVAVTRAGYVSCLAALVVFALLKDCRLLVIPVAYVLIFGWLLEPARARFVHIKEVSALAESSPADYNNIVSRKLLWEFGWQEFKRSPWKGIGIGNYTKNLAQYRKSDAPAAALMRETVEPHNSFIKVLCEQGLPGLALFLGVLTVWGWRAVCNVFSSLGADRDASTQHERWPRIRHWKFRLRSANPWGVAILCGFGAFLLHNLTNTLFMLPPCAIGFWIALGLLAGPAGNYFGFKQKVQGKDARQISVLA